MQRTEYQSTMLHLIKSTCLKGALSYYILYHSETREAHLACKLGQYIVINFIYSEILICLLWTKYEEKSKGSGTKPVHPPMLS